MTTPNHNLAAVIVHSEPVTEIAFGADVEPGQARPEEKSHWINDDPIGFTHRDGATWASTDPYTGAVVKGFPTEADTLAHLVYAFGAATSPH